MAASNASYVWGVDSYTPAYRATLPYCLYDMVTQEKRTPPTFWGRYIRCPDATNPNTLDGDERKFLHDRGCAILPIYNRAVWHRRGGQYHGTFMDGVNDGLDALSAANTLTIPEGVWIYADLEPQWGGVSSDWILGWWCTMYASPYWGGVYTSAIGPYCDALNVALSGLPPDSVDPIGMGYWVDLSALWSKAYYWALRPHLGGFSIPPGWEPTKPSQCNPEAVQVWQYCGNHRVQGIAVDADLATLDGFSAMWTAELCPWQA